jgi:phage tail-like protein
MTVPSADAFSLVVNGGPSVVFSSLGGLNTTLYGPPTAKGGPNTLVSGPSVTLTRALADASLWQWQQLVTTGVPTARKDCVLTLLAPDGSTMAAFELPNAWVTQLRVTAAPTGTGMLETVVLTCDTIIRMH